MLKKIKKKIKNHYYQYWYAPSRGVCDARRSATPTHLPPSAQSHHNNYYYSIRHRTAAMPIVTRKNLFRLETKTEKKKKKSTTVVFFFFWRFRRRRVVGENNIVIKIRRHILFLTSARGRKSFLVRYRRAHVERVPLTKFVRSGDFGSLTSSLFIIITNFFFLRRSRHSRAPPSWRFAARARFRKNLPYDDVSFIGNEEKERGERGIEQSRAKGDH